MASISQFLNEMATDLLTLGGATCLSLLVLIVFRAGRSRGLTEENMAERLGDLCMDTIKDKRKGKVTELLNLNSFFLPP